MGKALVLKNVDFSANKLATIVFGDTVPCTGITLDESTKAITALSPFTLVATPTPSNTTDTVEWSTSDDTVATVADGVVTPLKLGTVTITATCGSYSASCAVTIDNVVPSYVAVCGYSPFLRSSMGNAMTTDKKTAESISVFIIAANQAEGLETIESKVDVDTSPYRFVPILIPAGATKIVVSSTNASLGKFKTRTLYCDSTKQQTTYDTGIGAFCVQGSTSAYDQGSTQNSPIELTIPDNVAGLDSVCIAVAFQYSGITGQDYSSDISIVFSYGD